MSAARRSRKGAKKPGAPPLADFEFTMTVRGVTTITLDHLTRLLIRETEFGERVHWRGALALRRAYRESMEKLNADDWCGKETADEEDDEHGTTL